MILIASSSSSSSLLAAIKECASARDLRTGRLLHAEAIDRGFGSILYVANSLVNMYAKCGSLADAREVFDQIPSRSVVSWNSLLLGYAENGEPGIALELFAKMLAGEECEPNALTFMAALKACSAMARSDHGRKDLKLCCLESGLVVYNRAVIAGFHTDILVATTAIDMFAKCGDLDDARMVFDRMPNRSVVSWNAMLLGCVENGRPDMAMELFLSMTRTSISANSRTFLAAFSACTALAEEEHDHEQRKLDDGNIYKIKTLETAMAIHALAARSRSCDLDTNFFVVSSLIDMYAKCRCMDLARCQFDRFRGRHDVVSWTALLLGYAENGEEERALEVFSNLPGDVEPNALSFVAAIKACSGLAENEDPRHLGDEKRLVKARSLEIAMAIHSRILGSSKLQRSSKAGGRDLDKLLSSSLVDLYAKCGSSGDSARAFSSIDHPDTVAWNALIHGYAINGDEALAIASLWRMLEGSVDAKPDSRSYAAALKACGGAASLQECRKIHARVIRGGLEQHDSVLINSLVDAYGRCGSMADAQRVFDAGAASSSAAWNTLLAGYSRQGDTDTALRVLRRMSGEGRQPDAQTATSLLAACSHAGLVDRARAILAEFESIGVLDVGHYHAVIDVLGRANQIDEAVATIERMPFDATALTWMIVLNACSKWRNVEVGRRAFESVLRLTGGSGGDAAAAYVLMSNIYKACKE